MGNDSSSLNGMSTEQKQFKPQTALAHEPPNMRLTLYLLQSWGFLLSPEQQSIFRIRI